jgi:hypothetical protein
MNENQSLILLPQKDLFALFWNPNAQLLAPDAKAKRDELIERSSAIERVAGESSQKVALSLLGEVTKMADDAESVRKTAKDPFFKFGKRIDETVAEFCKKLIAEKARLKQALGAYQLEQDRIAREARLKQEAELAKLQAERKAAELAVAHAQTQEQVHQAQEAILAADVKAAEAIMQAPAVEVKKPEGATVIRGWEVEVVDIVALYKTFPECVELKPKKLIINDVVKRLAATIPEGQVPQMPGCKVTPKANVSAA